MFGFIFKSFSIRLSVHTAFALLECSARGLMQERTRSLLYISLPNGENVAEYAPSSFHFVSFNDFSGLKKSKNPIFAPFYLTYLT